MLSDRIRKHQDYKPPLQASEVLLRDTCGQWADQVAALETANADLLEALENLSGAVHAVGYDTVSIIHPALLNANEAIRKARGE